MTTCRATERFGLVKVSPDALITTMKEKGKSEEFINIGYLIMKPGVFDYLTAMTTKCWRQNL